MATQERAPLLPKHFHDQVHAPSPLSTSTVPQTEDEEELELLLSPEELQKSMIRWSIFWVVVIFLIAGILIFSIRNGNNSKMDWRDSLRKALGGGIAGAIAMVLNVLMLMPLRTIMNYQYRFGGKFYDVTALLYASGLGRFWSGLSAAIIQGPLSRFSDTFANVGILTLLAPFGIPLAIKTILSSLLGALFRMILVPVDTVKTTLQTQGPSGLALLKERIRNYGIGTMWNGAFATAAASFLGSFPWFFMYNQLDSVFPKSPDLLFSLSRSALIGFSSSAVSDTISNSLRVLKTYRQVHRSNISYLSVARIILKKEGMVGLLGRGLRTRILANGLQGLIFSVLWKIFMDLINGKGKV